MIALPPLVPPITFSQTSGSTEGGSAGGTTPNFLSTLNDALQNISADQHAAAGAEHAVAVGAPGASMATALILSDQAELGFNAVVAVRNELTNAASTLLNMQI